MSNEFEKRMNVIHALQDANRHTWKVKIEFPPVLFNLVQRGEFGQVLYDVRTFFESEGYEVVGVIEYGYFGPYWEFTGVDDRPMTAKQLRLVADKLDELNAQLEKERTVFDRIINFFN